MGTYGVDMTYPATYYGLHQWQKTSLHQLCCAFTCCDKQDLVEKDLLHCSQSYCCVDVCFVMWRFRPLDKMKVVGQIVQVSICLSVWISVCVLRDEVSANDLLQKWQEYGFSPVCVHICVFKCPACTKYFWQISHLYGLSPVWFRICIFRWLADAILFLHTSHSYGFSPVCILTWIFPGL